MNKIYARIAQELNVMENQVTASVALLDEGATVPFISRYRKEVTGGLDDTQLRNFIAQHEISHQKRNHKKAYLKDRVVLMLNL